MADPTIVSERRFGTVPADVAASVVIVAWRRSSTWQSAISALAADGANDVEVLLVPNGVDLEPDTSALEDAGMSGRVVSVTPNAGPSPARNLGASRANGELLCFLDDDAIPHRGWVRAFRRAIAETDWIAARGRIVAHQHPGWTRLARAYDLGNERRAAILTTEGNLAIRSDAFKAAGGFAPIYGHEGVELSDRLTTRYGEGKLGYVPDALVSHDFTTGLRPYLEKRHRHGRVLRTLPPSTLGRAAAVRRPITGSDLLVAPVRALGALAEAAGWIQGNRAGSKATTERS